MSALAVALVERAPVNAANRLLNPTLTSVSLQVMSFGLWHMLYTNDPEDYGRGLRELQSTLQEGYRIRGGLEPLLFWLNNPFLITERLNTEVSADVCLPNQCPIAKSRLPFSHFASDVRFFHLKSFFHVSFGD